MKQQKFSFKKRLESFGHAFNGIGVMLKEEHNSRIHLLAAFLVIIAGFYFDISTTEWFAIVISIGIVFTAEAFNSSLENVADFISPEKHEQIKKVKDLAAAGVLMSALAALAIGLIIFLPKIFA